MLQVSEYFHRLNKRGPPPAPGEAPAATTASSTSSSSSSGGSVAIEDDYPPEVKALITQLNDIERTFNALEHQAIVDGKGAEIYSKLRGMSANIQSVRANYPDELRDAVKLYNTLNSTIPKRVNEALTKHQQELNSRAAATPGNITHTCFLESLSFLHASSFQY
jgi:hypothetical protein